MRRHSLAIGLFAICLIGPATAQAGVPLVSTGAATAVTNTSATLNGTVNPNKDATTAYFEYGTSTAYGTKTVTQNVGGSKANRKVSQSVTGLTASTTYHFRVVATNASGMTLGPDKAFTTLATAPPGQNAVTLFARPNPVIHGGAILLSGQISGPGASGQAVTLEQNPYPYTKWVSVGTVLSAANGSFSLQRAPKRNTRYRVSYKPNRGGRVTSPEVLERVRVRLTLAVTDATPARGQLVRFFGSAFPPHTGRYVYIQRRTGLTGAFTTIARTRLLAVNAFRSRYTRAVRISRSGYYRVVVYGHADHAFGFSAKRRLVIH